MTLGVVSRWGGWRGGNGALRNDGRGKWLVGRVGGCGQMRLIGTDLLGNEESWNSQMRLIFTDILEVGCLMADLVQRTRSRKGCLWLIK